MNSVFRFRPIIKFCISVYLLFGRDLFGEYLAQIFRGGAYLPRVVVVGKDCMSETQLLWDSTVCDAMLCGKCRDRKLHIPTSYRPFNRPIFDSKMWVFADTE